MLLYLPSFEDKKDEEEYKKEDAEPDDKGHGDGVLALDVESVGKHGQYAALFRVVLRLQAVGRLPAHAAPVPDQLALFCVGAVVAGHVEADLVAVAGVFLCRDVPLHDPDVGDAGRPVAEFYPAQQKGVQCALCNFCASVRLCECPCFDYKISNGGIETYLVVQT